jgi:hypothetical protein
MQRAHQRKCERQFKGNSKATQRQKKKIEEHKSQKQVKRPGGAIDQAAVS